MGNWKPLFFLKYQLMVRACFSVWDLQEMCFAETQIHTRIASRRNILKILFNDMATLKHPHIHSRTIVVRSFEMHDLYAFRT